ncbi:hypothetical protein GO495_29720 [Chitinophaga oryziterrae]|uniref:Alpha/beta hydrolase n=1 Tax=Chitinophaga oryziterrae TaxID=1031224 RepID=A0A6N8JHW9_9BACT|nr:alpha/beta hydrolase-fold protein [Chitinophaga oryziterrae]MVT44807.1 hypothetical protein [Chitinophaga oryziterrae]
MNSPNNPLKIFTILFLLVTLQSTAQKKALYNHTSSEIVVIPSKILNEDRTIYIHYPKLDSMNLSKRFPVLYLMDGESHFDMLSQYTDYLSRWDVNVIPQMIVVGIPNTKRTRDLTPTKSIINYFGQPDTSNISRMKPSGGSDQFLQFIQDELMPYIETNYKTKPFKIFAGHSFGGITSIYCMLTHPDMFNAYISISPSFWWDGEYVLKPTDKKLEKGSVLNKTLFYCDANEGVTDTGSFHTNLLKFDTLLTHKELKGLCYKYKYYPAESHMTEPIVAYYDALRFIYRDWKSSDAK